jgi:hypothetical protein
MRRALIPLLIVLSSAVGCGQVRQDRAINFSDDGKTIAMAHDRDGVFVADGDDAAPKKIFQPGPDVSAVSAPLWSPTDKRLLFTTAEPVKKPEDAAKPKPKPGPARDADPAGDVYGPGDVVYTCWLREAPKDGVAPEPAALFSAPCDHAGYVAANLAVRWSPDGRSVLYIKQTGERRHELFAFDLEKKTSERVFPHAAAALIFDLAPDKKHLTCVLGSGEKDDHSRDGVWVGVPGAADWWHVPDTAGLAQGELNSLLEQLRAARPIWSADGARFAFVTSRQAEPKGPWEHTLHFGAPATRGVEIAAKGPRPYRDLHWAPDGTRLGVVLGPAGDGRPVLPADDGGSLVTITPGGAPSDPINTRPVHAFAGWDATGATLAYVATDPAPRTDGAAWAFAFLPDLHGRDAVFVQDKGDAAPREVFSGMRVTFPQWSPTEPKLSLWATFTPTYHSWLSWAAGMGPGVRSGDPAAVYDPGTGAIHWKAVNAREKAQIASYYLLKRDYDEAWRWFEQADKGAPAPEPPTPEQFMQGLATPRDSLFFEYYCLNKMGRAKEADAKKELFERTYLPKAPAEQPANAAANAGQKPIDDWNDAEGLWIRDLYEAEVFLSVDAAEDGEAFFRDELRDAATDDARVSKALVLSQLLLLRDKRRDYADLTAATTLPLLLKLVKPAPPDKPYTPLAIPGALSLLPLCSTEFLKSLPDDQVRALSARWRHLQTDADTDDKRLAVDLLLSAAHGRLGEADARQAAAQRVAANPASERWLGKQDVDGRIKGLRDLPAALAGIQKLLIGAK